MAERCKPAKQADFVAFQRWHKVQKWKRSQAQARLKCRGGWTCGGGPGEEIACFWLESEPGDVDAKPVTKKAFQTKKPMLPRNAPQIIVQVVRNLPYSETGEEPRTHEPGTPESTGREP